MQKQFCPYNCWKSALPRPTCVHFLVAFGLLSLGKHHPRGDELKTCYALAHLEERESSTGRNRSDQELMLVQEPQALCEDLCLAHSQPVLTSVWRLRHHLQEAQMPAGDMWAFGGRVNVVVVKTVGSHFGWDWVNSPPILKPILVGIGGDPIWGFRCTTHVRLPIFVLGLGCSLGVRFGF